MCGRYGGGKGGGRGGGGGSSMSAPGKNRSTPFSGRQDAKSSGWTDSYGIGHKTGHNVDMTGKEMQQVELWPTKGGGRIMGPFER